MVDWSDIAKNLGSDLRSASVGECLSTMIGIFDKRLQKIENKVDRLLYKSLSNGKEYLRRAKSKRSTADRRKELEKALDCFIDAYNSLEGIDKVEATLFVASCEALLGDRKEAFLWAERADRHNCEYYSKAYRSLTSKMMQMLGGLMNSEAEQHYNKVREINAMYRILKPKN